MLVDFAQISKPLVKSLLVKCYGEITKKMKFVNSTLLYSDSTIIQDSTNVWQISF